VSLKTYGSLFAGVGGIDLGLDESGLDCLFQVEIDDNCQQTLSYHWPNVPKFGDIKDVSGYDLPFVDVITFGSPCQDLSVAGKRAGLDGERSGLFFEATRIIKEMREKSNGQYPKWSIWENVVGALSSNTGADFGQALYEMDEAGACFSEWSVLDAQYFGVPQRRRRVYLLSVFDSAIASRCPDKILPVKEGSSGNIKKSIKQGEEATREIANCLRSGGEGGVPSSRGENLVVEIVGSLQARDYKGVGNQYVSENKLVVEEQNKSTLNRMLSFSEYKEDNVASAIKARDYKDSTDLITGFDKNVRRLTPLECERLMGWPDNHTLNRLDGKTNSDSTRYKMCGNGVASPVIKWVIDQIKEI
jgi:DNA (cytosine-5)-methyltransferase 1